MKHVVCSVTNDKNGKEAREEIEGKSAGCAEEGEISFYRLAVH